MKIEESGAKRQEQEMCGCGQPLTIRYIEASLIKAMCFTRYTVNTPLFGGASYAVNSNDIVNLFLLEMKMKKSAKERFGKGAYL